VQWHAEDDPQHNPINRKLFEAFAGHCGRNGGSGCNGWVA
jgi:gamma-glutamyl-gamma-aminobutyrate hydrolase PuuD